MNLEKQDAINVKAMMRRMDFKIVPLLMLGFAFCYLDRVNIGHARLYGIESSLSLTTDQYAWTISIFFVGFVIFGVPSNLVMMYLSPNQWLSCLMIMFGLITTSMAFVTSFAGLMITRVLLGTFEAGFLPGIVFYFGFWYSRQEQGIRIALVSASTQIAGCLGGLISYSMSFLVGKHNFEGWQWLFLVEGMVTIIMGILIWIILPPMPKNTKWLTSNEKKFIQDKISLGLMKTDDGKIDKTELMELFFDIKIYLYVIIYFGLNIALYAMSFLMPSIIKDMGFTNLQAMLMSSPPSVIAFITSVGMAYHADKHLNRSPHLLFSAFMCLIGFIIFISFSSIYIKYVSFFLILPGTVSSFPSITTWASNNFVGSTKSATSSAFMICMGNLSGILAGQLYRPEEAPQFFISNIINIILLTTIILSIFLLRYLIQTENHRLDREKLAGNENHIEFRYIL